MKRAYLEIARRGSKPDSGILIESLMKEVGLEGTLVFPTFNFDFPDSKYFSVNSTPSQMGKITEDARRNQAGFRSGHPVYSFFAIGKNAHKFSIINNYSGYGNDSPFAVLLELGARICVVDLEDQESMTFYHHVEEMNRVEYRYHKKFRGDYEDVEGKVTEREYSLFVRNLELGILTDVNRMGQLLWQEGLYCGNLPGEKNGMRSILADELFNRTSRIIQEGRAEDFLYSVDGKSK
jgi:aminoglycoside 3-N-acetyltransferase